MNSLSPGETMLYAGIAGVVLSILLYVVLKLILSKKEKKLKAELNSEYFNTKE